MTSTVRDAWRTLLPHLPPAGVAALRRALACDSPDLITGGNTYPMRMGMRDQRPVQAACVICYCLWQSGLATVGEVESAWDELLPSLGPVMWRIGCWWDDSPRERSRVELMELLNELACGTTPALPLYS